MSRSKRIYILLGILLAVCLVTFGVSRYEEHKEQIKNSDEIILELAGEDVTALSWKQESETLSFHKDKTWVYDEDETFPVNEEKIQELLELFQEFGVSFIIEDVEDYGQYGLDAPICTIHIEAGDKDYDIQLGDYSAMDSERYVSIGDGNAYLVKNDPLESFDLELQDMIQHDEVPDFEEVKGLQFTGAESYDVIYEKDSANTYCADDVYFVKQNENYLPLDTSNVEDYIQTINDLSLTNYVSYDVSEDELVTYGLDDPELAVTVQYSFKDEDEEDQDASFELSIARDSKEKREAESTSEDKDESEEITAYARVGNSKIIYKIAGADYENLMEASYNNLRHQKVLTADFEDIYQVDISLEGKNYTLTSEKKKDETIWYYDDEELEISEFKNALMDLKVSDFEETRPEGKEEISLTVYLDNENYPEVHIGLYRYDGSLCITVVDEKPVSRVDRSYVIDLVEAVHAIVLD